MADLSNLGGKPATSDVSTLSSWAGPYVTNMLGKTQALAESPYQVYQGPMTAGASNLQSKVFQGLGSLNIPSVYGQSFTGASPQAKLDAFGNPTTGGGTVSQYMNPYLQDVLKPQLDELRRQSGITQLANAGKALRQGAFGGTRQALMDTETQRNLLSQMDRTVGTGYSNAYDKAMQQFNTEQAQAKSLVDTLAEQGMAERAIEQQGITADLNEFLAQRDYPQKMLQFQQSMLQGLPISTVTTQPGQQSTLGALASTSGGVMEALKDLGIIK